MLEDILRASVISLSFLVGCTNIEKPREELSYKANYFYTQKEVLKQEDNTNLVRYSYKNGIEAEVLYEKNKDFQSVLINIKSDIRNVLVRNTPAITTPANSSYKILLNNNYYVREVKFDYNGSKVKILLDKFDLIIYVDDKAFNVPKPFNPSISKKATELGEDLSISDHLVLLDGM